MNECEDPILISENIRKRGFKSIPLILWGLSSCLMIFSILFVGNFISKMLPAVASVILAGGGILLYRDSKQHYIHTPTSRILSNRKMYLDIKELDKIEGLFNLSNYAAAYFYKKKEKSNLYLDVWFTRHRTLAFIQLVQKLENGTELRSEVRRYEGDLAKRFCFAFLLHSDEE